MSTQVEGGIDQQIFRGTHRPTGSVLPSRRQQLHEASGLRTHHPRSYNPAESFSTGDQETGLICLSGSATVSVDGKPFQLGQYDAIYVPRDSSVKSQPTRASTWSSSPRTSEHYPLQFVRFAEISKDPALKFNAGGRASRQLNILLAKNVEAGRLVAGFTYRSRATGPVGRRTSTPRCSKKCMSTSTCPLRHSGFSWCTTTRSIRRWSGSCAMAMRC